MIFQAESTPALPESLVHMPIVGWAGWWGVGQVLKGLGSTNIPLYTTAAAAAADWDEDTVDRQ